VGELPLNCQTKFLRVLEEQVFERVGGGRSIAVDVRVVAATNRNLPEMVRRGQFRDDLYYRLSVIHTVVPSLRERPTDIPALVEHFLARFRSQVARRIAGVAPEAMQALMQHDWPGNVRELRNAVERAIVLGDGAWIRPEHLPPDISDRRSSAPAPGPSSEPLALAPAFTPVAPGSVAPGSAAPGPAAPRPLHELERDGIIAALQATGGNKVQAAALLQIDRSTLYKKIKDYSIPG
jgi:DNA-binding NtrC family response regulator